MLLGASLPLVLERLLWARDELGPGCFPLLNSCLVCHAQGRAQKGRPPPYSAEVCRYQDLPYLWFLSRSGSRLLSILLLIAFPWLLVTLTSSLPSLSFPVVLTYD